MNRQIGRDLWQTLKAIWYVISPHELPDPEHAEKLAALTARVGELMGLSAEDVESLEYALLLHDIGLIRVQDKILKKPGRLTSDEYLQVQAHTIESEKILNMIPRMESAAQWVRWHHEWWDGSGYPDRLYGKKIPLPSRILVVIDAWDAMQSERPYRAAKTKDEAMHELRLLAGIQFDPAVVKALQAAAG